jgi:ubiquinone biosynthesis protein COQ4
MHDRAMASVGTLPPFAGQTPAVDQGERPFLLRDPGTDEGGTLGPNLIARECDGRLEIKPIVHPHRRRPELQLGKAWHHFKNVLKDKEQTDQVVAVIDALPWRGVGEAASAFLATERGRAIYQSEPYLPDFLDDHAALRRTPKGSLAHAYCDFMEYEGLTAAEMVRSTSAREPLDDGVGWYIDRLRDYHDILHVVTGYGRDLLGEQCNFAFMYHQRPSPGHLVMAWLGTLVMKAKMTTRAPILRALVEARRNGKACPLIVELPIHELFAMPLAEVRRMLNIPQPRWYDKVLEVWRAEGIDPHAFGRAQTA